MISSHPAPSLLIRSASTLLTGLPGAAMRHDTARLGGDLRVRAGRIEAIGHLDPDADEQVIDARGCVELLLSGRTTVADHP